MLRPVRVRVILLRLGHRSLCRVKNMLAMYLKYQLLTLSHELAENLHKGIQTDLIILDFSKAFEKVPHNKLLMKMENYGIRGNTWRWARSFLSDRTQQVLLAIVTTLPFSLPYK